MRNTPSLAPNAPFVNALLAYASRGPIAGAPHQDVNPLPLTLGASPRTGRGCGIGCAQTAIGCTWLRARSPGRRVAPASDSQAVTYGFTRNAGGPDHPVNPDSLKCGACGHLAPVQGWLRPKCGPRWTGHARESAGKCGPQAHQGFTDAPRVAGHQRPPKEDTGRNIPQGMGHVPEGYEAPTYPHTEGRTKPRNHARDHAHPKSTGQNHLPHRRPDAVNRQQRSPGPGPMVPVPDRPGMGFTSLATPTGQPTRSTAHRPRSGDSRRHGADTALTDG